MQQPATVNLTPLQAAYLDEQLTAYDQPSAALAAIIVEMGPTLKRLGLTKELRLCKQAFDLCAKFDGRITDAIERGLARAS